MVSQKDLPIDLVREYLQSNPTYLKTLWEIEGYQDEEDGLWSQTGWIQVIIPHLACTS